MTVCVKCRMVGYFTYCTVCGVTGIRAPHNWRPPRKTNDIAWKRIAKGDWLWDHNAVAKKASTTSEQMASLLDRLKRQAALRRRG